MKIGDIVYPHSKQLVGLVVELTSSGAKLDFDFHNNNGVENYFIGNMSQTYGHILYPFSKGVLEETNGLKEEET